MQAGPTVGLGSTRGVRHAVCCGTNMLSVGWGQEDGIRAEAGGLGQKCLWHSGGAKSMECCSHRSYPTTLRHRVAVQRKQLDWLASLNCRGPDHGIEWPGQGPLRLLVAPMTNPAIMSHPDECPMFTSSPAAPTAPPG